MKKILISTGGSGGHVIPALNLYDHLKKDFDVKLYTDSRGAKFFPKEINKTIFLLLILIMMKTGANKLAPV